jgi:hypothetical protein
MSYKITSATEKIVRVVEDNLCNSVEISSKDGYHMRLSLSGQSYIYMDPEIFEMLKAAIKEWDKNELERNDK